MSNFFSSSLRSLRYRNFRLYFTGQTFSLVGTWMQMIAVGWLVYRLTESSFYLGMVGFLSQIPTLFMMPLGGVVADRVNRHRLFLFTQILSMIQALVLAVLVLTNHINIWGVLVLGILMGVINGFDMPSRLSLVNELVEDKKDLGNAIALNSSMVNAARLIGPSLAGMIVAAAGEGVCFFINGLSYIAVIVCLAMMHFPQREVRVQTRTPQTVHSGLREGLAYVRHFLAVRDILLLLTTVSLFGAPLMVLMPVFAKDVFGGGPRTFGFLMAASGLGALMAALILAAQKNVRNYIRWIIFSTGLFGACLVAFSFSKSFWLALIVIALAGFGMMIQISASNAVLQTVVEKDKRGRVMSLYGMAFVGMMPLGNLLAGLIAPLVGAPHTVAFCGGVCVVVCVIFLRRLPTIEKEIHMACDGLGIDR